MELNPQQQQAVQATTGACLVLAGAGSGKTGVIVQKIAHLIRQGIYHPKEISAVTFTNKAAREMKERVAHFVGKEHSRGLRICTFHTLGFDIVKIEYSALGFKPQVSILDEHDQLTLFKELTSDLLLEDKDLINLALNQISSWKNNLVLPHQALSSAQSKDELIFAQCYERYQAQIHAYNAVDFDDLIMLPSLLFKHNSEILAKWQQRIKYLLVDEYQDTNASQYELIKLIVGKNANFTVVGDDDQSIYAWRGANPQNMHNLAQDFPDLKVIKLEQNYRSTQRILHCANILIANNDHLFTKNLFSQHRQGEKLQVLTAHNEEDEALRIVGEIFQKNVLQQVPFKDFAVLYRGNHQARILEKHLIQNRIPYRISGGTSFFSRAEIKDMLAYLRVLNNPDDDPALLRIINLPKRGIGTTTLQHLGTLAKAKNCSLFETIFADELIDVLTPNAYDALQKFARWQVELADNLKRSEPVEILKSMLADLHYEEYLYDHAPSPKMAEMQARNVAQLFQWVEDMLKGNEYQEPKTLAQVVAQLTLRDMLERGEGDENSNEVQLMTLHASKGLEFLHVFLMGMEEGILPHQNSIDEDNIAEERRLAYVGITRAKHTLTFTLCKERSQQGQKVNPEPSRFLAELPTDDLEWEDSKPAPTESQKQATNARGFASLRAVLKND